MRCTFSARLTARNHIEKARARSRATCGARPRNCTDSSAAASLSPARRRMRQAPVLLDQVEQRVAALLLEHVADQRAEHVHVVAQRGMFGRELDVVALHGARHSTVNCPGIEHCGRVWNHALMEAARPRDSVSECCSSPARRSCSPARGCSARRCTSAASASNCWSRCARVLAMPLFAWIALRAPATPRGARGRRPAPARRTGRGHRRHHLLLRRRHGRFLGADADRRVHRTRAAVQLSGDGGADRLAACAARAAAPRGAGHAGHLCRHLLRHGRRRPHRTARRTCSAPAWC